MTVTDIPQGFERQTRRSPLTDPWEPIYTKQTPDAIILGLWLATPHTNARGFVHGGLIAALTDKAMGHSCGHKMRGAHSLVTVSMDRFHQQRPGRAMADRRDRCHQDRQHHLLRTVFRESGWYCHRAGQWHVPGGAEEGRRGSGARVARARQPRDSRVSRNANR
jgi:acyl-coenzyme A thioesterase PaaI-like protein